MLHGVKKYMHCLKKLSNLILIQPTFVTDFPIEVSPLAKRDAKNPDFAARFELFIAGMEIGNGFNELNDPFDQAERFKQQCKHMKRGMKKHIIMMLIMFMHLNMVCRQPLVLALALIDCDDAY